MKYEGLPCCFYEEKQVAHSAGRGNGCYTEDYSVSVQYTLTEEPPPTCYAGPRDLSQRIPIIPEDVDCDLGLPQDCHGMHNHSPWGGALSLDVPRLHWSLGTTREEEQAPCYQAEVQPGCSPEEAGASRASLSSAPQDTQESHALAAEASAVGRSSLLRNVRCPWVMLGPQLKRKKKEKKRKKKYIYIHNSPTCGTWRLSSH